MRWLLKQAVREAATICPVPCKLTFDLLTLKVVSESRVTWDTSVPILIFLCLSVFDLGPMYATDRQTSDVRTSDMHHRLMPIPRGKGIINYYMRAFSQYDIEILLFCCFIQNETPFPPVRLGP